MKPNLSFENTIEPIAPPGKKLNATVKTSGAGTELIRFEEKKGVYVWVQPEEILFVKSADHYVKSLIQQGSKKKWMIRHCTLKDMLAKLTHGDFIRLNKFYMLNRNHFSHINEKEKTIYLDDDFSVPVPHRISRYVLELLNQ